MYLPLPTEKEKLAHAIEDAVTPAERERNIALIEWYIIHYYLQGVRLFSVRNWEHGDVSIAYENFEDELTFRWEHILRQYRVAIGRFMQIDVSPVAKPQGYGLNSMRHAAMGHAILLYMTSHLNSQAQKSRAIQCFLKYGTVGLRHYRGHGATLRDKTCVWIVPPWEVLCYPAEVQNLDDVRGIWHKRKVPLDWIREQRNLSLPRDELRLQPEEYTYGDAPDQYGILDVESSSSGIQGREVYEEEQTTSVTKEVEHRKVKWVDLTEGWMFGDREDEVLQYVVKIGKHVALAEEYTKEMNRGEPVLCPIGIARHTDTGRFYGRGEVGPLIGINDQVEKMLARQFQIVSDMDEYGMLLVPTSSGINLQQLKKRERRKILPFEPDPISPQIKPDVLAPFNSGDTPGKLANLGVQLQDKIAGQSGGLFEGDAPGRTDSAAGLGFLYQTSNVALVGPSNNLADAYRTLYRSIVQAARHEIEAQLAENPMGGPLGLGLDLPLIDDRMVGVVLDASTGQLVLDKNPIPHPNDIDIDIMDRNPINKAQAIQEAKEQLQMGNMTQTEFQILNFRESYGLPIVNRAKWEAYRKAVYQKILLFNDGDTPGQVPMNFEADDPEVTLIVVSHLMSSLEFMFASARVRSAFEIWKMSIELQLGTRVPGQLPLPEEMAEQEMAQQGAQGGPGLGGPGGPFEAAGGPGF